MNNKQLFPIECSDEFGLQGVENAKSLSEWLNSWLMDDDSKTCIIEKVSWNGGIPLDPASYQLRSRLE